MTPEPTIESPAAVAELHIHLTLAGLAALMRTVEEAMVSGSGELRLGWSGVTVTVGGSEERLHSLTLTWRSDSDDGDDERQPDPLPRARVIDTVG